MSENKKRIEKNEVEIDLRNILQIFMERKKFILSMMVVFVALVAIYNFVIVQPVYEYNALIRFPASAKSVQVNSWAEILKSDIGRQNGNSKLSGVTLLRNTALIKVTLEGENRIELQKNGDNYIKEVLERINLVIVDEAAFSAIDIKKKLTFINEKLQKTENNKSFFKAEVINDSRVSVNPIRPNKERNVIIAGLLSCFFSCCYVLTKYFWNRKY